MIESEEELRQKIAPLDGKTQRKCLEVAWAGRFRGRKPKDEGERVPIALAIFVTR